MSKKNNGEGTDSEITHTHNDLGYVQTDEEVRAKLQSLLGDKPLKNVEGENLLIMVADAFARKSFFSSIQVTLPEDYSGSSMVLGPYEKEDLTAFAKAGQLRREDRLQSADGRWKPVAEEFPEWGIFLQGRDELTGSIELTETHTMTQEGASLEEDIIAPKQTTDELELEDVFGENITQREVVSSQSPQNEIQDLAETEAERRPLQRPVQRRAPAPKEPSSFGTSLIAGAILVVGAAFFWMKNNRVQEPVVVEPDAVSGFVKSAKVRDRAEWPPELRPRKPIAIHESDSPLLRKIRPILSAYEGGVTTISRSDEYLLRRLASPASASWEVRKMAANQLAVFWLSRSRINDAKEILRPILVSDPGDFTTLVNKAVIHLAESKLDEARESLKVSLRLSSNLQWLSMGLLGYVEGLAGRWKDANQYFLDALNRYPNNPYIYGLWLRVLLRQAQGTDEQIAGLVENFFWGNPDVLIDAPIPAPLASYIVKSEALEGLEEAVSKVRGKVGSGRFAFAQWLKGRSVGFGALTQPVDSVRESLGAEESLQSQALYAYLLARADRFEEAAQVLARILPLVEGEDVESSWIWTLAGDVQVERSQVDQAILYYQAALNRNNYDYAAVHGLGLMLRERGQYNVALQKIEESQSLRPSFAPAILRISRFEWQSLLGVQ